MDYWGIVMNTWEKIKVMQAYVEGKQIQIKINNEWDNIDDPTWSWSNYSYRIKPEKKIIDLSVVIKSGIDCVFLNPVQFTSGYKFYDKLSCIGNDSIEGLFYKDSQGRSFRYCSIRQNQWFAWLGGERPLPEGLNVQVIDRNGSNKSGEPVEFDWKYKGTHIDIIAFKVLGVADGYKYEWEE